MFAGTLRPAASIRLPAPFAPAGNAGPGTPSSAIADPPGAYFSPIHRLGIVAQQPAKGLRTTQPTLGRLPRALLLSHDSLQRATLSARNPGALCVFACQEEQMAVCGMDDQSSLFSFRDDLPDFLPVLDCFSSSNCHNALLSQYLVERCRTKNG